MYQHITSGGFCILVKEPGKSNSSPCTPVNKSKEFNNTTACLHPGNDMLQLSLSVRACELLLNSAGQRLGFPKKAVLSNQHHWTKTTQEAWWSLCHHFHFGKYKWWEYHPCNVKTQIRRCTVTVNVALAVETGSRGGMINWLSTWLVIQRPICHQNNDQTLSWLCDPCRTPTY